MKQTLCPKRADLILVGYRLDDTVAAMRFCEHAFVGSWVGRFILVVNRPELEELLAGRIGTRWEIVRGSNELAEFSGWQEGLDYLGTDSDRVIFLNDTVTTHRLLTIGRKLSMVKAFQTASGASIVGKMDFTKGFFELAGLQLGSWISTFCFMLTSAALRRMNYRLYDPESTDSCVPGGLLEDRFFANMSPDLERHLRHLLFEGGWYASEPLSSSNNQRMKFKARCVVAEKTLSARCFRLQVTVIDSIDRAVVTKYFDKMERRLILRLPTAYRALHRLLPWG